MPLPLVNVVQCSEEKCSTPIRAKLKYATSKNFVGRPIDGYEPNLTQVAFMTPIAAAKLCEVQNYLNDKYQYGLLIYDAYRPKRAVLDFLSWSKQPAVNNYELERKNKHYPHIEKDQLFALGYVSEDSGHCYGNTVDLTLVEIASGKKLDMGARFDFMDEISHNTVEASQIGFDAVKNRKILSDAMCQFGFHPYAKEFWHFSHGGKEGREVTEAMDLPINTLL